MNEQTREFLCVVFGGLIMGVTLYLVFTHYYLPRAQARHSAEVKAARDEVLRAAVKVRHGEWAGDKDGYPVFRWASCPLGTLTVEKRGKK